MKTQYSTCSPSESVKVVIQIPGRVAFAITCNMYYDSAPGTMVLVGRRRRRDTVGWSTGVGSVRRKKHLRQPKAGHYDGVQSGVVSS